MTIEQFCGQLQAAVNQIGVRMDTLARERSYITETMSRLQGTFGDQKAGQDMVTDLYLVINSVAQADSALSAAATALGSYIQLVRSQ